MIVDHKMPISRALLWILVSILLISGSAFMAWLYFLHVKERRLHDDAYRIVAIIQNTSSADTLKSSYLAELLSLSLDQPMNLYQFHAKEAQKELLANPLFKNANVKKILPGTVYIQYQLRTPIAYLGDYTNTAIDQEGFLIPFHPFFTPKHLPTLFLGLKEKCKWGDCLHDRSSLQIAFAVLQEFHQLKIERFRIKQVDVSQIGADSYGQRQVVVILEEICQKEMNVPQCEIFLRLNSDNTLHDLASFRHLHDALFKEDSRFLTKRGTTVFPKIVIDLRIPHLAFIQRGH